MMMKLLLVLGILMFCANGVFAYSMPRWSAFSLSVYLPPEAPESLIVKSAFDEWKNKSKTIARFIYRKTTVAKRNSNVNVIFSEKLSGDKPYRLRETYVANPNFTVDRPDGYFVHVDITIALNDKNGKPYSNAELKAIALEAIGRTLGIKCGSSEEGVMACTDTYDATTLSDDDTFALFRVYRRVNKSVMEKYNK